MLNDPVKEKKVCGRCAGNFECGAKSGDCDCFAFALEPAILAELREKFSDCLCMKCLRELAAKQL